MLSKIIRPSFFDKLLLLLYAFCVAFSMNPQINVVSLYVFVPLMGVALYLKGDSVYYKNTYLKLYSVLVIWMTLTAVTAIDSDVAWRHMIRLFAAYIFSVISFYLASKSTLTKWLYLIIIVRFIAIYYRASSGGELVIAESLKDRHQFEEVNANMLAYFLFYATFAVFMLLKKYKDIKFYICLFLAIVLLSFSFYISLITASRQVLLIQVPLIIFLLLAMFFKFSFKNIITLFFLFSLALILAFPVFENYFSNSLLAARSMENFSDDSRFFLIQKALDEGMNYPLLGMGPNNFVLEYNQFTHNTYLELLVSSGFPAMLIYVSILLRFIFLQFKRFRITGDRTFLMLSVYACTFFIDNVFYVFIGNMWLMGLFFIVVGHSEQYYKTYIYETKRS